MKTTFICTMVCVSALVGCTASGVSDLDLVGLDAPDNPLPDLDEYWQERFDEGDALFEAPHRDSQGLGPAYIRSACSGCHADDARGPGVVQKMVVMSDDGVNAAADQSALPFGHTLRPLVAGGAVTPLIAPDDVPNLFVSVRAAPAVFARGYMEAVTDEAIEQIAADQAAMDDGIQGVIHRVAWQSEARDATDFHAYGPNDTQLIGRFGLKGRIASLDEFTADAYQGDMSLTTPLRPTELDNPDDLVDDDKVGVDVDLETVDLVADYVRLLDIPARASTDPAAVALFEEVGCATCHVPTLRTRADYPVPHLAGIDAPLYTDLLLHDMGDDATDGMTDGLAGPTEWKTPPLVGLRFLRSYLHDGRAETVADAIDGHAGPGSEANAVVDTYQALSDEDRELLLAFVAGL